MAIPYSSRSDQHRYCLGTWDRCLKWDTEALSMGLFPARVIIIVVQLKDRVQGAGELLHVGTKLMHLMSEVFCAYCPEKSCVKMRPSMIWLPTFLHSSTATLTVHSSRCAHKGPPVIPDQASSVGSCWYPCRVTSRQVFTCHPVTQAARNQPSK